MLVEYNYQYSIKWLVGLFMGDFNYYIVALLKLHAINIYFWLNSQPKYSWGQTSSIQII